MKKSFPPIVYLNGHWLSHDQAFVSVFDRGFLLGDGVYEVIPFYKGKPLALKEHLERLRYCLNALSIQFEISGLEEIIELAVEKAGLKQSDSIVYIQVTRGVAPRTHFFPEEVTPTILVYAQPVLFDGFTSRLASVIVSDDLRWHRCDIKSISLMGNVIANQEAHRAGADENILVRNGYFTEGSHTSVFFVRNGVVYTHPTGPFILDGITRRIVIRLCLNLGIPVKEEPVAQTDFHYLEEAFLTGTTTQILAIGKFILDRKEYFISKDVGSVTRRLQTAFSQLIESQRK